MTCSVSEVHLQGSCLISYSIDLLSAKFTSKSAIMNDYGMRSLSEDSANNLNHIHVESLCETISDFLDTLDGSTAEFNNEELVEKRLSESECSILDCGLIVADIINITREIEGSFVCTFERDRDELTQVFGNLDRICDQVLPALDHDLGEIEHLTGLLEARLAKVNRDKTLGWMKKFIPGGNVKSRENHTQYTNQVTACKTHSIAELLDPFENKNGKHREGGNEEDDAANTSIERPPHDEEDSDFAML